MRLGTVKDMTDQELEEEWDQLDRKLLLIESENFDGYDNTHGSYLYERFDEIEHEMHRRFDEKVKGR